MPNEGRRSEKPGDSEQPTLHLYALPGSGKCFVETGYMGHAASVNHLLGAGGIKLAMPTG